MNMKNIALTILMVTMLGLSPTAVLAEGDSTLRPEQIREEFKERTEKRSDDKKKTTVLTTEQIACIKTSVVKREDALIVGFDAYAMALKNARQIRRDALSLAWDKTVASERRAAVKAADRAFAEATKVARKTWNESRRATWKAFELDRRACNAPSVSAVDTGSSATDASI